MEVVIVKQPRGEPLRRRVLRRQRRRTLGSALCLMGHQSCEALVPVAIGVAIDVAVASGEPSLLLLCLAGLAALFAALTTCYRWFARLGQGAVIEESHALRTEIAARALTPGAARRRHGELLTIASSDADQAARSVIWVAGLCGTGAALVVSCGVLLTIDLRLGAVLIGTAVLVTVALNAISPLLSRRAHEQQRTLAGASALATDLVAGLRVVHGLGAQAAAVERYRRASRAAEEAGIRAGTANSLQRGATVLGASVVLTVSVGFAGYLALEGAISVGAFIAAVGVAQFISEPLTGVGTYLQVGAASKASAGRVRAVLDDDAPGASSAPGASPASSMPSPPDGSPAPGAPDAAPLTHDAAPELAIRVREGEFLGVVADHGQADRIVAALRTPRRTPPHVEPHRPDLFAGSIAENLALGRRTGDPMPAVDAAGARDVVDAQPAGLDEHVRDRGLSLSGGQRQRLAVARALHADPETLVLVDPTTAVDPITERKVAEGIRRLRHDDAPEPRATVVITGSPVLLQGTDRVVFDRGDAPPVTGTHHELLAGDDDYRRKVLG